MTGSVNILWRIHPAIFDERLNEAISIIDKIGDSYELIPFNAYSYDSVYIKNLPVVSFTSIRDAIKHPNIGCPHLYFNSHTFKVSSWMPHADNLLNPDTFFVPFSMIDKMGHLFDKDIFVRPNTGNKAFTACCVSADKPCEQIENYNNFHISDDLMCAVTSKKTLPNHEYRFWIVDRQIATYSSYSHNEDTNDHAPGEAMIDRVNSIIKDGWQPDVAYVIDLVWHDEKPKIIEYNALSTSGIYGCDIEKLFNRVKKVATREYLSESFL